MNKRLRIGDIVRINGHDCVVAMVRTRHGLLVARVALIGDWRQFEVSARPVHDGEVIGRNLRHAVRAWLAAAAESHGYLKRARLARTQAIWRREAEHRMAKANRIERLWRRLARAETNRGGAESAKAVAQ